MHKHMHIHMIHMIHIYDNDLLIRIVLDCAAERIRDILMQAQQVGMMTGKQQTTNIPDTIIMIDDDL